VNRMVLTIAAALATAPAFAQVPDFDTARHCAEFAKGSRTVENECRRNEADARRELEGSRMSPDVLSSCKEQVRPGQSYVLLFGCTLNEAALRTNQRRIAPIPVGPIDAPKTNAPTFNTGAGYRPAPAAPQPGSVTVMRGSETTIEKPPQR
jgi:hypothetical protein